VPYWQPTFAVAALKPSTHCTTKLHKARLAGFFIPKNNEKTNMTTELAAQPPMTSAQIVKHLKDKNQDFEWYPTTDKMIEALYQAYHSEDKIDAGK